MNINKVIVAGRLTRDPELRFTGSNTAVCEFSVATNRRVKNKDTGQWEDAPPVYVDVTAWAGSAEAINKHFAKGREIYIEGRLHLDQWEDKQTGQKRSKLKVVCESFQFVGGRQDGPSPNTGQRQNAPQGIQHEPVSNADIPF